MDFADLLLGHVEKHYTKQNDLTIISLSVILGYLTIATVIETLNKLNPETLLILVLVPVLIITGLTVVSRVNENKRVLKIQEKVILNHKKISCFDDNAKKEVLELVRKVFDMNIKDFGDKKKEESLTKLLGML
jgi:ABC-type Na+ transport system ATPase subunit NatA